MHMHNRSASLLSTHGNSTIAMDEQVTEALLGLATRGFSYRHISEMIRKNIDVKLSTNAIEKRLRKLNFPSRRGPTSDSENDVRRAIVETLENTPHTVGYRTMTDTLRRKGVHVRRHTVMKLMREVDGVGVNLRHRRRIKRRIYRSMGPNHTWHIDGYDKLKPYGLAIHGCIDGYSRKLMWLSVASSNNDPAIVAVNFVDIVRKIGGCPLILQSDPGTENGVIGALQCVFRHDADDTFAGIHSFQIARSVFNQRIEAWWCMFRRRTAEWWIQFLRDLESAGLFHRGNETETFCMRFCFIPFLQTELDRTKEEWNAHYISRSRDASCPNGRPDVLYSLPEENGGNDCLYPVSEEAGLWAQSMCVQASRSGSLEFDNFARQWFATHGLQDANNWQGALHNYVALLVASDS